MNKKNQTVGGISGIIEASLYIFGIILLFSSLHPAIDQAQTAAEKLQFIIENKAKYQLWMLLIYVIFGIVLIPLTIAIHEIFENNSTLFSKAMPVFGFIWSGLVIASGMIAVVGINAVGETYNTDPNSAITSWKTIETIQNGLGGGVEIIGGIWVLLISIMGLTQSIFNKGLNYLGLIVGSAGILTIIPALTDLGVVFGLTQIFWFLWIGIAMIKNGKT
ncbi:DUF4386 family protein [Pseudotamlana agarivorans]|uniref:DUF4386 family protein n=1 Tax=Pseudotamlana agarivorans TaxID=481183 RepID=UPI00083409F9|nr:DUF4386 family protein [Tamlana agarivorans]